MMAQQYITAAYESNFPSMQHQQSSMHFKSSPVEMIVPVQCNQNQGTLSMTPVHILPYVSSSEPNNHNMTNIVEPIVSSNTMSPSFKSDDMPTLSPYSGQFNFQIFIPNGEYDEAKRKGQTCVFQSDKMGNHQLFTKPQPHYWRLNYSADPSMSTENMFIRMVPVFGDPEKAQCILERCPKHKEVMTDDNVWKNRSMLIVEKTCAHYFQDPATKRVCILLPFEKHAEGESYSSVNCQFACYNSCFNQDSGGRKTLYLIITLEVLDKKTNKFELIGRQCLQFRSCACPSRDWRDKKIKGDPEMVSKIKEKRIKCEEKLNISKSTPINMGGKDAIIRVLPSLPGIDEAINALVSGYLLNRVSSNAAGMDSINDVFRQLKNLENCIIEQFTSSYDHNRCESKSRSQTPESQISPNASNIAYNEFNTLFEPCHPYRQLSQPIIQNYSSQALFNIKQFDEYSGGYDMKQIPHEVPTHFDELASERNYNRR